MRQSKSPFNKDVSSPKMSEIKDDFSGGASLLKNKKVVNKHLTKSYQNMPCLICFSVETTCGHHVTTKGAGGGDTTDNLMPLCYIHHAEIHESRNDFFEKYLEAQEWANYHCREDLIIDDN